MPKDTGKWNNNVSFCRAHSMSKLHLFGGPMNPGAALIVKYCGINISAIIKCITVRLSTISLWL